MGGFEDFVTTADDVFELGEEIKIEG